MSNSSPPIVDYTREVRFAVVMYGGVSLAIYPSSLSGGTVERVLVLI